MQVLLMTTLLCAASARAQHGRPRYAGPQHDRPRYAHPQYYYEGYVGPEYDYPAYQPTVPGPAYRDPGFPFNSLPEQAPLPADAAQQRQPQYYTQQRPYFLQQQRYPRPRAQQRGQQHRPSPPTTTPTPALDAAVLFPTHPPLPTHPPTVTVREDGTRVERVVFGAAGRRAAGDEPAGDRGAARAKPAAEQTAADEDSTEPDYGPITPVSYGFSVNDPASNNDYGRVENQDEKGTTGSYRIALPDGRTQIVTYRADRDSGFVAEVTYEGQARYPEDLAAGTERTPTRAPVTFFGASGGRQGRPDGVKYRAQ